MTQTSWPQDIAGRADAPSVFDRVVCGVDHTDAGLAAARVAARLMSPDGRLALLSVADPTIAVHADWAAPIAAQELARDARAALAEALTAAETAHGVERRLVAGQPLDVLLETLARDRATLAVVGRHEHVRAVGIVVGSVATYLIHEAPCPVLVVPTAVDADSWPRSIAVGLDGSSSSVAALAAARELAERFRIPLRVIAATRDGQVDLDRARAVAPELEEQPIGAVDALVVASERYNLVVVGSRGLRGVRALGSVSERVAHESHGPVLVVRPVPGTEEESA
jgi:nucleotide-binding universal stress UspA family protein